MESKKSTNDIIFAYMQNRNKLTDIEGKFTVTKGERGERRDKLGVWDEQIQTTIYKTGKDILYSTRNYSHYLITCNGV